MSTLILTCFGLSGRSRTANDKKARADVPFWNNTITGDSVRYVAVHIMRSKRCPPHRMWHPARYWRKRRPDTDSLRVHNKPATRSKGARYRLSEMRVHNKPATRSKGARYRFYEQIGNCSFSPHSALRLATLNYLFCADRRHPACPTSGAVIIAEGKKKKNATRGKHFLSE